MNLPLRVLHYGKDVPLPEQVPLRAGPLSLVFEAGDLRHIRLDDREVLRRVYVAVRDRNWATIPSVLSNLQIERSEDSFRITYDVEHRQGEIDFFWRGTTTGDVRGTLTFAMEGQARSTFLRNRVGFCILHPIRECAGHPCRVEKVDGSVEQGTFPRYISPHQPFFDMRTISHEVVPGVHAEVRFAGDTFEMEDQRNWTDGSYKTYCTPLRLSYPVEVRAGTKISQSVTLTCKGGFQTRPYADGRGAEGDSTGITFSLGGSPALPLPRIGLSVAHHGQPLSQKDIKRLQTLHLSHLRVDLNLTRPGWEPSLRRAADEAKALGVALEIALILSDAAGEELKALVAALGQIKPSVRAYLVFHIAEGSTSEKWVRLARAHLSGHDAGAKIGAGSNAFFTHLNRGRPPVGAIDLTCYPINPQCHAFDNTSLIENLEAQASTVESARQFTAGVPIAITPITLKMRFNPDATGPVPEPQPGELPAPVDVRQMSLFGAGWTVGSLKYLAESGASSLTYYETTGWRGVMETEQGSPLPERFRSIPGSVFPIYHVLADVGEFAGGEVIPTQSSETLKVDGIALRRDGRTRILVANLTGDPQRVTVRNLSGSVRVRRMDETNAQEAMVAPETFRAEAGELMQTVKGTLEISLLPYAVARIDSV